MQKHNAMHTPLIAVISLLAAAALLLPECAGAEGLAAVATASEASVQSERMSDYAQPMISVDDVLNATSSMEGKYPEHTYGTYGGLYFWMDNHRLIFSIKDGKIISWDADNGRTAHLGFGGLICYADGIVRKYEYRPDLPPYKTRELLRGPIGQEKKERTFDKRPRVNGNQFECGEPQSDFTTRYAETHLDELVFPLREKAHHVPRWTD